jgi:hypothetical protein
MAALTADGPGSTRVVWRRLERRTGEQAPILMSENRDVAGPMNEAEGTHAWP